MLCRMKSTQSIMAYEWINVCWSLGRNQTVSAKWGKNLTIPTVVERYVVFKIDVFYRHMPTFKYIKREASRYKQNNYCHLPRAFEGELQIFRNDIITGNYKYFPNFKKYINNFDIHETSDREKLTEEWILWLYVQRRFLSSKNCRKYPSLLCTRMWRHFKTELTPLDSIGWKLKNSKCNWLISSIAQYGFKSVLKQGKGWN